MRIGIVGAGLVGCTAAFSLLMSGVGSEVILVDLNKTRSEAEAEDLNHAAPFSNPLVVKVGEIESLEGCGIIILSCGVSQKPNESRLSLLNRNAKVFSSVVPNVCQVAPNAIIIVASNPVDIMTVVTTQLASQYNVPMGRIFGSGTILDTARFESFLAQHLGISSHSMDAYVLGEHGDSKVAHWSGASAGGIPVRDLAEQLGRPLTLKMRNDIDERIRDAANHIIKGKGSTYYGIGAALAKLCEAIVSDHKEIYTVTMLMDEQNTPFSEIRDTAISLPRIVGGNGVEATLRPDLTPGELQALEESAAVVINATNAMTVDIGGGSGGGVVKKNEALAAKSNDSPEVTVNGPKVQK